MNNYFSGRIWVMGDDIDTDIILPTEYLALSSVDEMAPHTFAPLRPELAALIQPGDILVAGKNFGCGSSREQASEVLKNLNLAAIIAKSFARIFYRNAINNGLLLLENPFLHDDVIEGDELTVIVGEKIIYHEKYYKLQPMAENVLAILQKGGLVEAMRERAGGGGQ